MYGVLYLVPFQCVWLLGLICWVFLRSYWGKAAFSHQHNILYYSGTVIYPSSTPPQKVLHALVVHMISSIVCYCMEPSTSVVPCSRQHTCWLLLFPPRLGNNHSWRCSSGPRPSDALHQQQRGFGQREVRVLMFTCYKWYMLSSTSTVLFLKFVARNHHTRNNTISVKVQLKSHLVITFRCQK